MSARHQERYFSTFDIEADTFALGVKGLMLPVNTVRTLPYFPNYALLDLAGSLCDTLGINTPTSSQEPNTGVGSIKCYPNPFFKTKLLLTIQIMNSLYLFCMTRVGRKVFSTNLNIGLNTLDWSGLPTGVYFYNLISEKKGNQIALGRVVKLRT